MISEYGGIDGAQSKSWVLDPVVRILHGAPIRLSCRECKDGTKDWKWFVGENEEYHKWVSEQRNG